MIQPASDPIATQVAGDPDDLLLHGAVRFCGYAMVDDQVPTFRLYTNSSFDRWLEIRRDAVRAQLPPSPESQGRSYVWVLADTVVTRCESATAVYVAQVMDAGGDDDPTAYPRGSRG